MIFNKKQLNKIELKLCLIEFLYAENYISANEYTIALYTQKAFRKQRFIKTTISFNERVQGGKSLDTIAEIVEANRDWNRITEQFNKSDIVFIEKYLGCENTIEEIIKKNNESTTKSCKNKTIINKKNKENKENTNTNTNKNGEDITIKIIYKTMIILSKILYTKRHKTKLSFAEKIFMLKWLVNERGIMRVERETGIRHETTRKIIDGKTNFKFEKFEKLLNYFDLEV